MKVDIIILSSARNQKLRELTQQTIDSCHRSEDDIDFDILVIEQEKRVVYANCKTIHLNEPFNYNRFMNIGICKTKNQYVCICNNDLIFHRSWCTNILEAMKDNELLSACPSCPNVQGKRFNHGPNVHFGYNNSHHMSGWCIMMDRKVIDIIGALDEDFPFWFADNSYAEQLKSNGVKHALVRNSVVEHLGSQTLLSLSNNKQDEFTNQQVRKFIAKYPNNESAIHFKKVLRAKQQNA